MAELEALYENKEQNVRNGWRNVLPLHQPVKLGRAAGPADWWMNDNLISSFHATLTWDGGRLTVAERTPPPTNRIYYQSRPQPAFSLAPGDSFVIGNTVFMLHAGATAIVGGGDRPDATLPAEASFTRAQLRQVPFDTSATFLRALEQIPDVLRLANDEDMLFRNMVKVGLDALPHADAMAVVQIPPEATDADRRVLVRTHQQRLSGKADVFMPSRRLAFKAVRQDKKSVVHVWVGEKTEDMTMRMDSKLPGVPWAVCTPFKDDSGWGLYADGRLPKEPAVVNGQVRDKELIDYQKVVELIAGLIESTRKAHQLDRQLTLYRRFIPRRLWSDTSAEQLDELLVPKLTTATVMFCDLRGSCQFAEDGSADLVEAWGDLSKAIDDMTTAISAEDGIVAGFQGDAVMAFWGWPDNRADQIERAVKAALAIRRRFDKLGWWRDISCGIGIAHGPVIAGRMGASELAKVDVFGPTVNLASRLESLTKRFGVRILVDESVGRAVAGAKGLHARVRRLGRFAPAGMSKGVLVSELLPAENEPVQGNVREAVRRSWDEIVGLFLAGEWEQARHRFESFFRDEPTAVLLLEFMARSNHAPPAGWAERPEVAFDTK